MERERDAMPEPVIPFVDVGALAPQDRAVLDGMAAITGFVPASMRTYFHRPAIAKAIMGLMAAVFQDGEAALPVGLKVKLGVVCSAINGCAYCTSHQCHAAMKMPGFDDAALGALVSGEDVGADPVEQVCLDYARQVSFDPASYGLERLEALKEVLSAPQIVELAAVVGMWKMINTIHDTLHLPSEPGLPDAAGLIARAKA